MQLNLGNLLLIMLSIGQELYQGIRMKLTEQQALVLVLILRDSLRISGSPFIIGIQERNALLEQILNCQVVEKKDET